MNGSGIGGTVTTSLSGQQLASAIPSPTAGKSWRSKSMNLKHSATSSMLASPTHSPSPTHSTQASESLLQHGSDGSKVGLASGVTQRSMLEKFRLINPRSASRASPSVAEMALQEEDDLSEYGEDGLMPMGSVCSSISSNAIAKQMPTKTLASTSAAPSKASSSSSPSSSFSKAFINGSKSVSKEREEKSKPGKSSKDSTPPKEERESFADPTKKTSKIGSLIPKGGKPSSAKKDGGSSVSSGIPKPGLKAPSSTTSKFQSQSQAQSQATLNSSGNMRGGEGERAKLTKGGQGGSFYIQRSTGGPDNKKTSMTSSTSTSALSGSSGMLGGGVGGAGGGAALGGNGIVQLPQQQQHNHPNTATVAPFMYR